MGSGKLVDVKTRSSKKSCANVKRCQNPQGDAGVSHRMLELEEGPLGLLSNALPWLKETTVSDTEWRDEVRLCSVVAELRYLPLCPEAMQPGTPF